MEKFDESTKEKDRLLRLRIEQLCTERGVSFRQVSDQLGKASNYIQNIVDGNARPSLPALYEICDYFSISLCQFFRYTEVGIDQAVYYDKLQGLTRQQIRILASIVEVLNKE